MLLRGHSLVVGALSPCFFSFFKQKTAYDMRISDLSSDVCSSGLPEAIDKVLFLGGRRNLAATTALLRLVLVERHGLDVTLMRERHDHVLRHDPVFMRHALGRASCRERVCQYVYILVVAVAFNKNSKTHRHKKNSLDQYD